MAQLSVDAVRESFARVSGRLDQALHEAGRQLDDEAVRLRALAPGAATQQYGMPYCIWSYCFERRRLLRDGRTATAAVQLKYLEPAFDSQHPEVTVRATAELYRAGQSASFREQHEDVLTLDELFDRGIARAVLHLIDKMEQRIEVELNTE